MSKYVQWLSTHHFHQGILQTDFGVLMVDMDTVLWRLLHSQRGIAAQTEPRLTILANNQLSQIPVFHKFCHSGRIGIALQIILNTHQQITAQGGCAHGQRYKRQLWSLNLSTTCFGPVSRHEWSFQEDRNSEEIFIFYIKVLYVCIIYIDTHILYVGPFFFPFRVISGLYFPTEEATQILLLSWYWLKLNKMSFKKSTA